MDWELKDRTRGRKVGHAIKRLVAMIATLIRWYGKRLANTWMCTRIGRLCEISGVASLEVSNEGGRQRPYQGVGKGVAQQMVAQQRATDGLLDWILSNTPGRQAEERGTRRQC